MTYIDNRSGATYRVTGVTPIKNLNLRIIYLGLVRGPDAAAPVLQFTDVFFSELLFTKKFQKI